MKYLKDLQPGDRIADIYLCKHKHAAVTKNGKPYESVILQDKTGSIDAKIWDPNSEGIEDFDALDYIDVHGEVSVFNNALQVSIKRLRKCREGEYDPSDYVPVSTRDNDEMYAELQRAIASVDEPHLKTLLEDFFVRDEAFVSAFRKSSAAKSVHHGFVGGLMEHSLSVARICDFYCKNYPILKRDLLVSAALLHDIGKTRELSAFPENDYTDDGQYLGHIVIGTMMVHEKAKEIEGFPEILLQELEHCILSHHGEFEYGSPKKPSIIEALALSMADNTDAKIETFKEVLTGTTETGWLGYNRLFETSLRATLPL